MSDLQIPTLLVEIMPGGWHGYEPGQQIEVPEDMARYFIGRGFLKAVEKPKPVKPHKAKS